MKRVFRQIRRGLGKLPYVGEHPGIPLAVTFTSILFIIGLNRIDSEVGLGHVIVGTIIFSSPIWAGFLWGAYDRAEVNDRIARERAEEVKRKL